MSAVERAQGSGELARERRSRRWRVPGWLTQVAAVAAMFGCWELATGIGVLPSDEIPTMTSTVRELVSLLGVSSFWGAVGNTLAAWGLGLGLAALVAVPLGILIGSSELLWRAFRPVVEFLRPVPSVALIPLTVLVFGLGLRGEVFLALFATFWVLLIQVLYGVQDVDPVAVDTARSFGLGRLVVLYRIKLPGALPFIATGIRIGSAVSLVLAVTAELVIGSPGLGEQINVAQSGGAHPKMYALIIATGLLGWVLNIIATQGIDRVLFWHPSVRGSAR